MVDGNGLVIMARAPVTDLSGVAGELALDLLEGADDGSPMPIMVPMAQLWCLVAHVRPGDRRGFLFQCWQDWTARMRPAERVELAILADAETGTARRVATGFHGLLQPAESWRRYWDAVEWFAHSGAAPVNYLLFTHAREVHDLLAIPPAMRAVAANALRHALDIAGNPFVVPERTVRCPS